MSFQIRKSSPKKKVDFRIRKSLSTLNKENKPQKQIYNQTIFNKKKVKLHLTEKSVNKNNTYSQSNICQINTNLIANKNNESLARIADQCQSSSQISITTMKKQKNSESIKHILQNIAQGQKQILQLLKKQVNDSQKQQLYAHYGISMSNRPMSRQSIQNRKSSRKNSTLKLESNRKKIKSNFSIFTEGEDSEGGFEQLIPKIIEQIMQRNIKQRQQDELKNQQKRLINIRQLLQYRLWYHRQTYSNFANRIINFQSQKLSDQELVEILQLQPYNLQDQDIQLLLTTVKNNSRHKIQKCHKKTMKKNSKSNKKGQQWENKDKGQVDDICKQNQLSQILQFFRQLLPSNIVYTYSQIKQYMKSFYEKFNLKSQEILYNLSMYSTDMGTIHIAHFENCLKNFTAIIFSDRQIKTILMMGCVHSDNIENIDYMEVLTVLKQQIFESKL